MEQPELNNTNPSYWPSVGIAAFIFGFISFVLQTIVTYMQINSEPTGSLFSPTMFVSVFVCLIGAFGGMMAVWHYAREYDIKMKLGMGALIGFLTGIGMVFATIVLSKIWLLVDPDMNQKLLDSLIANYEAMDMSEEMRQSMIDSAAEQADPSIGTQLLYGIPMLGILNLLTGMLGVSLFARETEE